MSVAPTPLEIFRAKGVPHRKMEDWKYSDLHSVLDADAIAHAPTAVMTVGTPDGVEVGFIENGKMPDWAASRIERRLDEGAMEASAQAFDLQGWALRVPSGVQIDKPLVLDFETEGHSEIVLLIERGASLTVLETHKVEGNGLQNISFSIVLEEGAQLTHVRKAALAEDLVSVETIRVIQHDKSIYRAHLMSGGAKLSRTEFHITLAGEGAEADLSGISVLGDKAHADITTRIDHKVGNTTSRQLFKMVAGGHSRAVYQGKIVVHEGADGADSRQTAKALLLSNRAEADLKPELEIFADDVKCAHGAAVGDLDADSLFYLRARGIPEEEARGMLIEAFLQDVVDGIVDETARSSAAEFIENGLARAMVDAP